MYCSTSSDVDIRLWQRLLLNFERKQDLGSYQGQIEPIEPHGPESSQVHQTTLLQSIVQDRSVCPQASR